LYFGNIKTVSFSNEQKEKGIHQKISSKIFAFSQILRNFTPSFIAYFSFNLCILPCEIWAKCSFYLINVA
jgi:hypothetical protein